MVHVSLKNFVQALKMIKQFLPTPYGQDKQTNINYKVAALLKFCSPCSICRQSSQR